MGTGIIHTATATSTRRAGSSSSSSSCAANVAVKLLRLQLEPWSDAQHSLLGCRRAAMQSSQVGMALSDCSRAAAAARLQHRGLDHAHHAGAAAAAAAHKSQATDGCIAGRQQELRSPAGAIKWMLFAVQAADAVVLASAGCSGGLCSHAWHSAIGQLQLTAWLCSICCGARGVPGVCVLVNTSCS